MENIVPKLERNNYPEYGLQEHFPNTEFCQWLPSRICQRCNNFIPDQDCLSVDNTTWHSACLRCSICDKTLTVTDKCYWKNGLIYCREHYQNLQRRACAGCGALINATDLVFWARQFVYHESCFVCTTCRERLKPGQRYSLDDDTGRLHCCNCWSHVSPYEDIGNMVQPANLICAADSRKSKRRKRKNSLPIDPMAQIQYGLDFTRDDVNCGFVSQKVKRVRTSFKKPQLEVMKNFFSIKNSPDANDLKKLSLETGLAKRILQVWFQNARAKQRRGSTKETPRDTSKNPCSSVKTEKNDYSGDDMQQLANNSVDLKPESERGDGQSISGNASEFESRSPGLESMSSESRSDAAETSSSSIPWTYEGFYQPEFQSSQASYIENNGAPCHPYLCNNELEEHVRSELYSSGEGPSDGYQNAFNEMLAPSAKHSYGEMYHSFAQ